MENKKKRKKHILLMIFLSLALICISVILYLFTSFLGPPEYIYLDNLDKHDNLYRTDEVQDIFLINFSKSHFFMNNLKYCKNLRSLTYSSIAKKTDDIEFLSGTNLTDLYLAGNFDDWSPLYDCSSLKKLTLNLTNFSDLKILQRMGSLNELYVDTYEEIDYSGYDKLSSLKKLTIYAPNVDMHEINKNRNVIDFSTAAQINNIEALSDSDIEVITLYNSDQNAYVMSMLLEMKKLQKAEFHNCTFSDPFESVLEIKHKLEDKGVEVVLTDAEYQKQSN